MYELGVLGSPRLIGPDGNEVRSVLSQPKRLALLSYLAVTSTGAYVRRDKLVGLLWAESTEERARASLSQALSKLRRSLDPAVITTRGEQEVGVDASQLGCDAVEFLRAVDAEDWPRAVEVYGGPLLDGFFLDGCPEFGTWLEHTRAHLRRTAVSAFGRLTEQAMAADDESARALAERGYEIDPLDGGAVRLLMQVLARAGQRDAAVGVYERYAATVREERGIEPSQETVVLVQRIREGRLFRRPGPDEEVDAAVVSPAGADPRPSVESAAVSRLNAALEGRYRIERQLGQGGMATVYLADDLKHDRKVALKVLKPELAAVVGAERFLAEIKTTANLQHPHILPLFDSGEADGFLFYVMPYVGGESVRERLDREHQLPVEEAVRIATDVAEALDYAHAQGVIHRDIKPANILLQSGRPAISDFGIALAVGVAGGGRLTETGLSLGTPQYMSPEQASSDEAVDSRSDLYSLGVVLYEMLTGEPPFTGKTSQAIMARLLTDRPTPPKTFRDAVPEALERTVLRSLAKVPADRFETLREFAQQLDEVAREAALPERPAMVAPPRTRGFPRWSLSIAGTALVASAVLVVALVWTPRAPPRIAPTFRQLTFAGNVSQVALSPDGKLIAYVESPRLGPFRSQSDRILVQQVAGDELHTVAEGLPHVCSLRFSPTGDRLTFSTSGGNGLEAGAYWVSWLGGTLSPIVQGRVTCLSVLSPDGSMAVWVWSDEAGRLILIREIPPGSGQRDTLLLGGGRNGFGDADWSRSGRWIVAQTLTGLSSSVLETISPHDGTTNVVVATDAFPRSPRWSANDEVIYYAAGSPDAANLMKLRVDHRTGRAVGRPQVLLAGVPLDQFDISADGTVMAMTRGTSRGRIGVATFPEDPTLAPVRLVLPEGSASDGDPAISPDGRTLAFTRGEVTDNDLYIREIGGGPAERITSIAGRLFDVQWSPDGEQLAFVVDSAEAQWVGVVSVSSRRSRLLYQADLGPPRPTASLGWAAAGIVLRSFSSDTSLVLSLLDPETGRVQPIPMPAEHHPGSPLTSPDGTRVLSDGWSRSTDSRDQVILSLPQGELRGALEFRGYAAGWGTNGRVYYHRSVNDKTEIWSVPSAGGTPTLHARLETRCFRVTVSRDGKTFACAEFYTESDVWLVEGFDSAVH